MCEHRAMNRRRNALADIFAGLTPEKIEQLQRFVNTDSGFEDESSADLITTTTSNPTLANSAPLDRFTDQSNPIDMPTHARVNGTFYDQITTNYLAFRDFESSSADTLSDNEEDERFVEFVNSPRYLQRRLGVVENIFRENLTAILASH